jgi:hypothetical protein
MVLEAPPSSRKDFFPKGAFLPQGSFVFSRKQRFLKEALFPQGSFVSSTS